MAKITIVLEDDAENEGRVNVTSALEPSVSFATIRKWTTGEADCTVAQELFARIMLFINSPEAGGSSEMIDAVDDDGKSVLE